MASNYVGWFDTARIEMTATGGDFVK